MIEENTAAEDTASDSREEGEASDNILAELPPLGEIAELPDYSAAEAWDSDLYVEPVTGIDNDFIRGVDISSYVSLKESGVVFRDFEGNEVDDTGFFAILREAGVNWVRIRIWNNPYDTKGNSYGGGHNDLQTAIVLGRLATEAGMKVMIDFHYSDFWADPNKQMAPKAWAHMTYEDKKTAMGEFTEDSMQALLDAEVNVAMVQVGNETVAGLAGETDWERICELMNVGSAAVRRVAADNDKEILIAMHFTNPDTKNFLGYAQNLADYGVDYDVFGTSYYTFWHGTTETLTSQLKTITETYGKPVVVLETSYAYTNDDGDGFSNSISMETENIALNYEISEQGQVNAFRDVCQA
ncbi:MAG: glycosyl hydrolase 53 family protein, partial [Lachnospiraceae bacterium]|nr:glycosyl hydrolase 53 family protein [Lachnospiraceae bacterium]